jgi:hypothetical protein
MLYIYIYIYTFTTLNRYSEDPRALHTYNNTQVPNDNTHDTPNEGRAILSIGEAGLR